MRRLLSAIAALALGLTPAAASAGSWSPGPDASDSTEPTFEGSIDAPAAGATLGSDRPFHVYGWILDDTAEGWSGFDQLHVYVGKAGAGGTLLSIGSTGLSRPDVAAATGNPYWEASGFDATVPAGAVPPGPAVLTVYAHSPSKGWWWQDVDVQFTGTGPGLNVSLLAPAANEEVPTTNDYAIRGLAWDTRTTAETGVGVDRVQVYLNGERGEAGSQLLGETSPDAQTQWSVTFAPSRFDKEPHNIVYVYARSAVTGEETLLIREFFITNRTSS